MVSLLPAGRVGTLNVAQDTGWHGLVLLCPSYSKGACLSKGDLLFLTEDYIQNPFLMNKDPNFLKTPDKAVWHSSPSPLQSNYCSLCVESLRHD